MMVYFRFLSSCFIDVVLIQVIAGLLLLCYANDVKLQFIITTMPMAITINPLIVYYTLAYP